MLFRIVDHGSYHEGKETLIVTFSRLQKFLGLLDPFLIQV